MTLLSTTDTVQWMHLIGARPCTERTLRRWVAAGKIANHGGKWDILIDTNELAPLLSEAT